MKYYIITILTIFIIHFKSPSTKDKESYLKNIDQLNKFKENYTTETDTIIKFVRENLYYSSLMNLSFCESELVLVLHNNDSALNVWKRKMRDLRTMYDDSIDNITTNIEINFFKKRLIGHSTLREKYPVEYTFLMNSFPVDIDVSFTPRQYRSLMLRFKNAGGGNVNELSDIYFTLLIIDGQKFIKAIETSPKCVQVFNKWINNIVDLEFVAYGADNVPPQLIERKRSYLLNKYSSSTDSLMSKVINAIKSATISNID
jgi:hypothetical protein